MNINATLLGQAISFAIFVWFCMQYVWPPLTAALAERQKKIAEGLSAGDEAQRAVGQHVPHQHHHPRDLHRH